MFNIPLSATREENLSEGSGWYVNGMSTVCQRPGVQTPHQEERGLWWGRPGIQKRPGGPVMLLLAARGEGLGRASSKHDYVN